MAKGFGVEYLDGKECFYLWAELGSLEKASNELERRGKVNPKTGKAPTRMSISTSARNWATENLKESYEVYQKCGSLFSWEDYCKWIVDQAKKIKTKTAYRRWLKTSGLAEYDLEFSYETLEEVNNDKDIQEVRALFERLERQKDFKGI